MQLKKRVFFLVNTFCFMVWLDYETNESPQGASIQNNYFMSQICYHKVLLVNIFHKIVVLSQIHGYSSLCLLWTKSKDKEDLYMTIPITFLVTHVLKGGSVREKDVHVNKLSSVAQHEFCWIPKKISWTLFQTQEYTIPRGKVLQFGPHNSRHIWKICHAF